MLSLQEALANAEVKRRLKAIKEVMDAYGAYHPDMTGGDHDPVGLHHIKDPQLCRDVDELLACMPLAEFLGKTAYDYGTTTAYGAYLYADKIHDELVFKAKQTDIVPLIGRVVTGWEGADLKVDIVSDHTYKAQEFISGGKLPTETVETKQATVTPKSFGINARITTDLIEDNNFQMIEYHLDKAAVAMGQKSTSLALVVLKAATDGWGTKNSATSATTDTSVWSEVVTAIKANEADLWHSNTLLCTREAWYHSLCKMGAETAGGAAGDYWEFQQGYTTPPVTPGFDLRADTLDVLFNDSPELHDSSDLVGAAFTTCVSIIFDRLNALLTGRKRWMQMTNYADPVKDMAGMVVTARQDSVTLYNDAVYVLTEKT